MFHLVGSRRR
nr:Chain D, ADP-ribosylation factor-like protein 3 [Saccharomyces cerevisiae]